MTKNLNLLFGALVLPALLLVNTARAQEQSATPAPDSPTVPQRLSYTLDLDISGDAALAESLRQVSRVLADKTAGAASASALNRRIRSDVDMFEKLLRSEGYYASSISRRTIPGRTNYQVMISIVPGKRYTLAKPVIELTSPDTELSGRLIEAVGIMPGAIARSEDIVITGRRVLQLLAKMGYPFAQPLTRDVVVDHGSKAVQATYHIDQGTFVRFGAVEYEGLVGVEAKYLDSFINWSQGESYSQSKVDDFRRRLIAMGLFQSVSVHPREPEAGSSESVVLVRVSERLQRTISVGGGFSTSEGFGAEYNWEHRNIFGQQERMQFLANLSEIEQSVGGSYAKPHFDRLDQTLTVGVKAGRENTDTFEKLALEGGLSVERRINQRFKASIGLHADLFSIEENLRDEEFVVLGLPLNLTWDTTGNPVDPERGLRMVNTITPGHVFLDDNFPFLKLENHSSIYFPVADDNKVVLALRTRLGATVGPSTFELPASERFFSGGGGSVRGYGYQEIGPINLQGDPTGGRSVAEFGFEVRARVTESIGIVPFIEGGSVYDSTFPKFSNLQWGAGVGFRYYTSVAPIRLDVAVPLNKRPIDSSFQIYISFGQSF